MFDSVLRRETLPRRRFGSGALIALLVHLGLVSFAIWAQASGAARRVQDVAVTFVKPPAPPPPPPPPAASRAQPRPKPRPDKQRTVLQQAIVAPTVIPQEKPAEQEPVDAPSSVAADGGIPGGEVGGVPGGIVGGVVDSAGPIEFDARAMTEPKLMGGPNPQYTEKALEREVQGTMVVKCVVTTDGRVYGCRVLRSLPFMDRAVVDALERRRYSPATMGGKPVEVDYTFRVVLRLPD